ncbi:MAG: single-stranded-DNA-specific exonuclease RecJ, partial [Pseudomonadota bacterium]
NAVHPSIPARRFSHAKEQVAVFGDYDVDGACSSSLMKRFFSHHGIDARIYIPDRLREGYGPNANAIKELIDDGAKLIVTVDCGTTSFEPLAAAKGTGTDVLVIDHHQSNETLPDVHAVVNPNRQDDLSEQGHLCAAGVVFLVMVATARVLRARGVYPGKFGDPALLNELDLVALATVCDVVPLVGLNRAYVTKGLQVMRGRRNIGLRALFDAAGLDQTPTPYHLGYILGPRINAGGRIGDSGLGATLLSTAHNGEAEKIAALLDRLNKERKAIEQQTLEEAMTRAELVVEETPDIPLVLVGSEEWHKGIVGLVASRLTERFHRPSCVLSWTKDAATGARSGTGSLRSVAGVDIGGAVRAAVDKGLLLKGGGHAMAAGLTVAEDKLAELEAYFAEALTETASEARASAGLEIDGALVPSAAKEDLLALIDRAGPFGQGNPQPRFVFPAARVKFAKIVGETHVRCVLEGGDGSRLEGIAFRAAGEPIGRALLENGGMPVHVAGHLRLDTWGGRKKIELMIEDVADPRKQAG